MGPRWLADLSQAGPPYPGPDSWELAEPPVEPLAALKVLAQVTSVHHHILWRVEKAAR